MLTSPIFRHAKPFTQNISTQILTSTVRFEDTVFVDEILHEPMNLSHFDIVDAAGRVLDRVGNVNGSEYKQVGGKIVVAKPGQYVLRKYDKVHEHDTTVIRIDDFEYSDGTRGVMGVKFWPEVLTQPEQGCARTSLDCDGIAIMVPLPGSFSFSYRLRNYLGQVTEPACVFVTAIA